MTLDFNDDRTYTKDVVLENVRYALFDPKTLRDDVVPAEFLDVVAAFAEACQKYNMKIGLYLSGGDKHFPCSSTPDPQGQRKIVGDIDKYFPVFL